MMASTAEIICEHAPRDLRATDLRQRAAEDSFRGTKCFAFFFFFSLPADISAALLRFRVRGICLPFACFAPRRRRRRQQMFATMMLLSRATCLPLLS